MTDKSSRKNPGYCSVGGDRCFVWSSETGFLYKISVTNQNGHRNPVSWLLGGDRTPIYHPSNSEV